jgi:hypothetical protein
MPAVASSRQPGAPFRFSGQAGQWLLAEERRWLAVQLAARPARPWLWLAPLSPSPQEWPAASPARGVRLHEHGDGYTGSVRCGLPLPLSSECLGDIVLQHPARERADMLLDECARVLVDGGRLWLFLVNPWSPYRLHGAADLPAPASGPWLQRLRGLGLQAEAPGFIGPCWRMGRPGESQASGVPWRAGRIVVAEKRGLAPVAPAPVAWRRGTAPAA